jgi:hypothetical protein
VLAIHAANEAQPETIVTVRRPTVGKNGIYHIVEDFRANELETPSEQRARTMSEQLEIQKLMGIMKPQVAAQQAFNEVQ